MLAGDTDQLMATVSRVMAPILASEPAGKRRRFVHGAISGQNICSAYETCSRFLSFTALRETRDVRGLSVPRFQAIWNGRPWDERARDCTSSWRSKMDISDMFARMAIPQNGDEHGHQTPRHHSTLGRRES